MLQQTIIFLEFEGVLTSHRTGGKNIDPIAVHFINEVCRITGSQIVISSHWRLSRPGSMFRSMFGDHLNEDWATLDLSRRYVDKVRGMEVDAWLRKHEGYKFVILDNEFNYLDEQLPYLIQPNSDNGLIWQDMYMILQFFGMEYIDMEARNILITPEMFKDESFDLKTKQRITLSP